MVCSQIKNTGESRLSMASVAGIVWNWKSHGYLKFFILVYVFFGLNIRRSSFLCFGAILFAYNAIR